jgi:hypothetical protein
MIADRVLQHRCNRGTRLCLQLLTSQANCAMQLSLVLLCDGTCDQPMFMRCEMVLASR